MADAPGGREVTVAEAQAAVRAMTGQSGEHRTARPPVPVEVWDPWNPGWWPGEVQAWRGDVVHVRYSRGPGMQHLAWLPAEAVRRVGG